MNTLQKIFACNIFYFYSMLFCTSHNITYSHIFLFLYIVTITFTKNNINCKHLEYPFFMKKTMHSKHIQHDSLCYFCVCEYSNAINKYFFLTNFAGTYFSYLFFFQKMKLSLKYTPVMDLFNKIFLFC